MELRTRAGKLCMVELEFQGETGLVGPAGAINDFVLQSKAIKWF